MAQQRYHVIQVIIATKEQIHVFHVLEDFIAVVVKHQWNVMKVTTQGMVVIHVSPVMKDFIAHLVA